jgi:ATP-binding cassette subfamily B protein/subfamily B ATP-binding cassette protein MsbA
MLPFIQKVLPYLKPYRFTFLLLLTQLLVINLCELLKPWPLKLIIDHVLGGEPPHSGFAQGWAPEALLLAACSGLILIYLLLASITVLFNYTSIGVGQRLVNDLRSDLYDHLQRLSLAFHSRREVGDLLYRVATDTYAIQSLTMNGLFPIASAAVFMIGMAVIMFRLDWVLTLVALIVCPILFVAIARLNKRIGTAAVQARQKEGAVYSVVQRTLSAIRVVQAYTKEEEEHRNFMAASQDSLAAGRRLYTLQTVYSGAVNVLIAAGTAMVIWLGAHHVLSGTLTIGALVVFISYLASLYGPINTMVQTHALLQESKAGVQRVFEVLDVQQDLKDGHAPLQRARGQICFEDVSFGYMPGRLVIHNVTFQVEPGQTIAIVGLTGAGKSTLVSLIPRFYDPLAGRVLLDGRDVRDYRLKDLRNQIAMVLQPPLVFPVSLRENIAYGRLDASLDEVIAAGRLAGLQDFIEQLPQRYDTVVGELGATLSEGERQRLTIARAILRNAPILILDEPTSSVDVETEAQIMEGLAHLTAASTTFIIAHRLSTIRRADRILVIRNGRIEETGSFQDLMVGETFFRRLYMTQWQAQDRQGAIR